MITLYTAVSLDGYIAEKDGRVDFLDNPYYRLPDEDYGYLSFYDQIQAVVMGFNTYKQIVSFEGDYPYQGKRSIVFSQKDHNEVLHDGVEITRDSEASVVQTLKNEGKNVWIIGGGATNARLHQSGLIDRMILTYLPITLGKGIPMFRENDQQTHWKNSGTRTFANGLVQITLDKR